MFTLGKGYVILYLCYEILYSHSHLCASVSLCVKKLPHKVVQIKWINICKVLGTKLTLYSIYYCYFYSYLEPDDHMIIEGK